MAPRPRVTLNCAASLDGRLAQPGGAPVLLSGPQDLARVHRLREEADGVLVGVGTVLADDPSLLAKDEHLGRAPRRQPARVVLDSRLRTPPKARVLDARAPCLVVAAEAAGGRTLPGARVLVAGKERVDLPAALAALHDAGLRSLLVEGGGTVLGSFLAAGLWDELTVYVAPVVLGPAAPALSAFDGRVELPPARVERLDDGALLAFARGGTRMP